MNKIKVEFDKEFDILYIIIGEPAASDANNLLRGVYERRCMLTDRLTGYIIEDYSEQNRGRLQEVLPMELWGHLP